MWKKITVLVLSAVLLLCGCSCNNGGESAGTGDYDLYAGIDFDRVLDYIVKDGASEYTIVFSDKAPESEKYAAGELQSYIAQATGVWLPLKDERIVRSDAKFVSVGRTALFADLGAEVTEEAFNGDGFVLKTSGKSLYICGANQRGTLYGVYDFLEKILGIKFLDIDTEYVPAVQTLPLYEMDVKEVPSFKYRATLSDSTYHVADKAFAVKARLNHDFITLEGKYGGTINVNRDINNVHNNLTYVSPTKYYSSDAQKAQNAHMFFIGSEGTPIDICYTDGIREDGTIDYTTVNAASAYVEGMKKYVRQNPNAEYYVCGQEDVTTCCSCARCVDAKNRFGTTTAAVLRFYNAIARDVQKWADTQSAFGGKEIKVVVFSYYFSSEAPVVPDEKSGKYVPVDASVTLADNVVLRFGDITSHPYYSFTDERNVSYGYGPDYMEKWAPIVGDNAVWYWTYLTNFTTYFGYYPYMSKVRENLSALDTMNCEYVLLQHNTTEYQDWKAIMDCYVGSKLCWNYNRNVKELQEEFIEYYFGIVAEDISAMTTYLDEWYAYTITFTYPRLYYDMYNANYVPAEHWEKVLGMIQGAQEKVRLSELSSEQKYDLDRKLERIKLMPLYALMTSRSVYYADDEIRFHSVTRDFFGICSEFGVSQYGEHRYVSDLKNLYPYVD